MPRATNETATDRGGPLAGSTADAGGSGDGTAGPNAGLTRWNSSEWHALRYAVYRTLIDMTVLPAVDEQGFPRPNALYDSAIRHGLLDPVSGEPTERLLWLNPGLRLPDRSR